jgi:multimeric flavodoxin WrbA
MKVVVLAGSPRKGGNTDILADEFVRGARQAGAEAEKVYLDDLNIRPIGEVCDVTAERVDLRDDDDYSGVLERFLDADVVVIASPVYWAGVSAQVKCFIDRLSCYFRRPAYAQRLIGKGYVVICTFGRDEPDHGKWVAEPMKECVSVLGGKYLGDLCVRAYAKGAVKQMPDALEAARELGANVVRWMAATERPHDPGM